MSNQMNKMIKTARQRKQEEERLRKEKEQAEMHDAEIAIRAALGETLFVELAPYIKARVKRVTPDGGIQAELHVKADPLEIAEFTIVYTKYSRPTGVAFTTSNAIDSRVKLETGEQLAQFLLERRVRWQQDTVQRRERRIQELFHILQNGCDEQHTKDAAAELAALDPDQAELAQSLLTNWYERHQVWLAQEAIKDEMKRKLDAAYQAYGEQMYAYYLAMFRIERENAGKVLEFQKRLNNRYPYFLVTFALVAEEDGQKYVETRTAYSAEAQPDAQGFWPIWKNAEIQPVSYAHVVSVEPVFMRPTSQNKDLFKFTPIDEVDAPGFWHHPDEDLSCLPGLIASLGYPPEEPDEPPTDINDRWRADTVAENARVRAINTIRNEAGQAPFHIDDVWKGQECDGAC